jgi:hypothetical protein
VIGFLQPLALLGLAAAAIPALLHLRQRQTPPTVLFPAVRYLSETKREHSKRLKLRNLLLLILRTLIVIFVVLAAARPVATVSMGGVHAPTAVALILDNSLSSGVVLGGNRMLDQMVERARAVLDRVADSDHLWVMTADGIPQRMSAVDARRLVDSLSPLPVRLDLGEAVRAADQAIASDPLSGHEIVVFSDRQATALSQGATPGARVLVWESPAAPANRGIDSARGEPAVWRPAGAVIASVGGTGDATAALQLRVAEREIARAVAAPGERVALRAPALPRGWLSATLALDPDELRTDDEWRLALRAADPAAVRAGAGAGRFVREGLEVLRGSGRAGEGETVVLDDRLMSGRGVLFPPADAVLLGAANRALTARGISWRFGERIEGEWQIEGSAGSAAGVAVRRRHPHEGSGQVLATAGGDPWLVSDGGLVIVASRLEEEWTALPVSAGFVPFLDLLINELAATGATAVPATPGAPVQLPPAARALHTRDGPVSVPADGRLVAPLVPGVYFLTGADGDTIGGLEVNHDPRESRLASADRRALRAAIGPDTQLLDDRDLSAEMFRGTRRADLSGLLVAAALLAALAELAVATAGGRQRSTG